MTNFTLRQLELFTALPNFSTLSAAAASLYISESALSSAITALEQAMDEQLCVRRRARGLQLTPAGRLLADRAQALLRDASELVSELAGLEGKLKGPVNIGSFTGLADTIFPPVLEGFPLRHPEVTLGVTVGSNEELVELLAAGLLDFAFLYDVYLPPGLTRQAVYTTEVVAIFPKDHPLACLRTVDLADLALEPLVLLDYAPSVNRVREMFIARGLVPRLQVTVPTIELVRSLVGRGLGYGLLMSRPNPPMQSAEGLPLASRRLSPRQGQTTVSVFWPEQMSLSRRAKAVVDYVVEILGETRDGGLPD